MINNSSNLGSYQVLSLALTDQNFLKDAWSEDGQAILEPKDGLDNWTMVHNFITDELAGEPLPISALVQVENGTTIPGLAGLATNRLKSENIQTVDPVNARNQQTQQTTITVYDKNVNIDDLNTIKTEFGVNTVSFENSSQNTFNISVVVGNDYNLKQGKKLLNEP